MLRDISVFLYNDSSIEFAKKDRFGTPDVYKVCKDRKMLITIGL